MPGCCVQRWSLSLGRWWGVAVYLHIYFLLFALLGLALTLTEPDLLGESVLMVGVLFVSVALHEVGHALAAWRVGGKVDAIVLGPIGGLISPRVPDEPEIHVFVALAGPIVHLSIAVLAAAAMAISGDQQQLLGLLVPLATPRDLVEPGGLGLVAAKLTLWLNWNLMLLNLLPAYPFDGGPVLRAMLWPALGRRTARIVTARVAMVLAVLICIAGFVMLATDQPLHLPTWMPLVALGVILFFSARQDLSAAEPHERADLLAGYQLNSDGLDLLDAMWSSDDEDEGVLVEHQQRQAEQCTAAPEASEDDRVDAILARLHGSSIEALSPEEVAVLHRASQRYRRRRGSHDE